MSNGTNMYGSILGVGVQDPNIDSDDDDSDDSDSLLFSSVRLLKKAESFTLPHNVDRGYRGTELKLLSFARPHMRAFHGSWMCFFASFFLQFAMAPILPDIMRSLSLTKSEIWLTNVWSVVGGVPMRFVMGPLCDYHGGRTVMTSILAFSAIPCLLSGLAFNLGTLSFLRFIIGSFDTFVPGQYWITCHFVREVGGTAMAISSGWGAMGSATTQLVVGSVIFPLCWFMSGSPDIAWRISMIVPAAFAISVATFFYLYSDDCPLGNFREVKKAGLMLERSAVDSFRSGVLNLNSWILFFQHAGSYGVDLTMCNGATLYYSERFQQPTVTAAAIAFTYGVSAIFARGLGGYISDRAYDIFSLRGRLAVQMGCMILQGLLTLIFARCDTLQWSIVVMIIFSIFVQMSMGTCFGIVPYVDGPNTGSIAGVVGAGGNLGAILFGNIMRFTTHYQEAFEYIAWFTIGLSFLTPFIVIKGYRGILFGKEEESQRQTLLVPGASPKLVPARFKNQNNRR
mmetsp:Transcript_30756/g.47162  ORF Transcript_30756/g.47162 Transcript_30756/m.47162 type:complete len:511 (-) Transcript_30756:92-1624(-)